MSSVITNVCMYVHVEDYMYILYSWKFSGGGGGGGGNILVDSIINHICGEKFVFSESIIANHAIMSKFVGKKFVVLY